MPWKRSSGPRMQAVLQIRKTEMRCSDSWRSHTLRTLTPLRVQSLTHQAEQASGIHAQMTGASARPIPGQEQKCRQCRPSPLCPCCQGEGSPHSPVFSPEAASPPGHREWFLPPPPHLTPCLSPRLPGPLEQPHAAPSLRMPATGLS